MFCGECGTDNPKTNRYCKNCGRTLKKETTAAPVATAPSQPVTARPPEVPHQPQPMEAPAVTPVIPGPGEVPKRTWLGIISLIPAILSWILYPVLLGIVAVVFGITSIALARKTGTKFPVAGVIAIIIGLLAIIVNIFWLDIFPPPQILPPIQ